MKLLIDICTVLCKIKKCTGLHILFSRSTHRSLIDSLTCRFDLSFKVFAIGVHAVCNKPISKD